MIKLRFTWALPRFYDSLRMWFLDIGGSHNSNAIAIGFTIVGFTTELTLGI